MARCKNLLCNWRRSHHQDDCGLDALGDFDPDSRKQFRRVFFFAAIGLLLVVIGGPARFGIGGLPWRSALLLAANDFISWTLAGLVVARCMEPPRHVAPLL